MYSSNEIYWLFEDCKTMMQLEFLCKWLKMLMGLELVEDSPKLRRIATLRYRELLKREV